MPPAPPPPEPRPRSTPPPRGPPPSPPPPRPSRGAACPCGCARRALQRLNAPHQVSQRGGRAAATLALVGRVGWCGKSVVYAMIGGLTCESAAQARGPPAAGAPCQVAASPQGAFVLLGTTPGGAGAVLLLVMVAAMRGTHDAPAKGEAWPVPWRHSRLGRAGLALLGLAFLIATAIQLQGVFSCAWRRDYRCARTRAAATPAWHPAAHVTPRACSQLPQLAGRPAKARRRRRAPPPRARSDDLPRPFMRFVFGAGHAGFAGRGGAFLALAVLFLKDATGADAPHATSMVANALLQLRGSAPLRGVLMVLGLLLVVYGLFASLSAHARVIPTPPPSRRTPAPAAAVAAAPRGGGGAPGGGGGAPGGGGGGPAASGGELELGGKGPPRAPAAAQPVAADGRAGRDQGGAGHERGGDRGSGGGGCVAVVVR
ncbi:hypothetical protein HT031_002456 [Scenedesmus sp. PABB004]|nr:hypothetical protein HT031_002456 [Scenedesmus sp. PABB004]